jgi:hypothetical protein
MNIFAFKLAMMDLSFLSFLFVLVGLRNSFLDCIVLLCNKKDPLTLVKYYNLAMRYGHYSPGSLQHIIY